MSIEARLYAQLTTHAGLAALIADRAYPVQLPQDVALPAVTYLRVSDAPLLHRSGGAPTYNRARFQVDAWATSYDGALALRKQIRAAMGAFVIATTPRVDVALPAGSRDALEAEPGRWTCSQDYIIHFEED